MDKIYNAVNDLIKNVLIERERFYYSLAYKRHFDDLESLDPSKYRFNAKKAVMYVETMQLFRHWKGELAGKQFLLEDWQKAMIYIIAGWEEYNGERWVRRFRTILYMTSRKSGKSFIAAAFGLADMILSSEKGLEISCCATKRDQAKILWDNYHHFILASRFLKHKFKKRGYELIRIEDDSKIFTVGRDSTSLDGLNISALMTDELHAHVDNSLREVLLSSMGSRPEAYEFIATTAGFNLSSPLLSEVDYAKEVLSKTTVDENYFAFLAIPDNDELTMENVEAANPNLGVSVSKSYMEKELEKAKQRPELRVNFKTKYLNLFVGQSEEFIPMEEWISCEFDPEANNMDLSEGRLFIGLDLSVSDDFTSLTKLRVFNDQTMYADWEVWNIQKDIYERQRYYRAPITTWADMGYITLQDTNSIYIDEIADRVYELMIEEPDSILGADPFRCSELVNKLIKRGIEEDRIVMVNQGFRNMNEALLKLRNSVSQKNIKVQHNPVVRWMVGNLEIISDSYGNMKPDRSKKVQKIDCVASLLDAIHIAIPELEAEETDGELVYFV